MNRLFLLLLGIALVAPLYAADAAYPSGSQGAVTLDWKKFDELWTQLQTLQKKIDKLEKPENTPPVAFTLSKAVYKGDVHEKKVDVSALFEIEVYESKKWVQVPFMPSSVALQDARLDGNVVGLSENEGFHSLTLKGAGRHLLAVHFSLKAPNPEQAPQLMMQLPRTPMTVLSMRFPRPNLDVSVEPSQGMETHTDGGETRITVDLPPTENVTLRWQKAVPEEKGEAAKLYLETASLLTLSENSAHFQAALNYTILHHSVQTLEIAMPEGWNLLSVNAEGLQEWKVLSGEKGQILRVRLGYPKKGSLAVVLDLEKSVEEKEAVVQLPQFKALSVEREQGTLGIESKGAVELEVAEKSGLQPIDPQELPPSLWQSARQPILFAFRYTQSHDLAVAVKRHAEVPVLTTTIDEADAVTLMTVRGQAVTRVNYQVRNHLKQYLTLRLPPGAQLWSAFVGGEAVKPTLVEKGVYRIPLAKSQLQGQAAFPVEVVYYEAAKGFSPLGARAVRFPLPDAPISKVLWSLYLPEKYRFLHFGGDMEKGMLESPIRAAFGGALFEREDYRARGKKEAFKDELKSLDSALGAANGVPVAEPAKAGRLEEMEAKTLTTPAQSMTEGVYPIAFAVPSAGQLFHFGQVMVVDQAPQVSMVYLHVAFLRILCLMIVGILCLLGYKARAHLSRFAVDKLGWTTQNS
jgi:hypothetical protein